MKELIYSLNSLFAVAPTSDSATLISLAKDVFIPIVTIIVSIVSGIFGSVFIWMFTRYETLRKESVSNLKAKYDNETKFLKMQLENKEKEANKTITEVGKMHDVFKELQPILNESSSASADLKRKVNNIVQGLLTAEEKIEQSAKDARMALDWLKLHKTNIASFAKKEILSEYPEPLKGKEKDIDKEIMIFINCIEKSLSAKVIIPLEKSLILSIDNQVIYERILKHIRFDCERKTQLGELSIEAYEWIKFCVDEMLKDIKSRI